MFRICSQSVLILSFRLNFVVHQVGWFSLSIQEDGSLFCFSFWRFKDAGCRMLNRLLNQKPPKTAGGKNFLSFRKTFCAYLRGFLLVWKRVDVLNRSWKGFFFYERRRRAKLFLLMASYWINSWRSLSIFSLAEGQGGCFFFLAVVCCLPPLLFYKKVFYTNSLHLEAVVKNISHVYVALNHLFAANKDGLKRLEKNTKHIWQKFLSLSIR